MKYLLFTCLLSVVSFTAGFLLRGQGICPVLNGPAYEGPCLLDYATGRITELRIGIQELHISAQGLRIHSGPDRATAYVPSEGYALADLTDPARPALYPLSPGGCYDIAGRTALIELDPDRPDGLIVNIF